MTSRANSSGRTALCLPSCKSVYPNHTTPKICFCQLIPHTSRAGLSNNSSMHAVVCHHVKAWAPTPHLPGLLPLGPGASLSRAESPSSHPAIALATWHLEPKVSPLKAWSELARFAKALHVLVFNVKLHPKPEVQSGSSVLGSVNVTWGTV